MKKLLGGTGRSNLAALIIGLLLIPFYFLFLLFDRADATSDLAGTIAALVFIYLMLLGAVVMFLVRGNGTVPWRRWLPWMLVYAFVIGAILLLYEFAFPDSDFIDIIIDEGNGMGFVRNALALVLAMLLIGLIMVPISFACVWIMVSMVSYFLPKYLTTLKGYDPDDRSNIKGRLSAWMVDLPPVLDPGTLTYDATASRKKRTRTRWLAVMAWQLVLGLLVAVYISLNPVLLDQMDYAELFGLVTYVAMLVPFLVLPWSTLESIGVKVKGVKRDFFLHEGAKSRMIQTLVALGTIVLIVRIGLTKVGAPEIASAFSLYILALISLSGLVSFIYFNYFEHDLVDRLVSGRG